MYIRDGKIIYSPSDLIVFMESKFDSWMDRFDLERPNEFSPDEPGEELKLLQSRGYAHEAAFLEKLRGEGRDVLEIDSKDAFNATLDAMRLGTEVIFQGVLSAGQFAGRADFLVKAQGSSVLGDFTYEVWDTKLARKPKPYFLIQLCCYADLLLELQGVLPQHVRVVLGDNDVKAFPTSQFFYLYRQIKDAFLQFQEEFSADKPPEVIDPGQMSRWANHATLLLDERDDLSRVAGMRRSQIKKLRQAGISTLTELATTGKATVERLAPSTFAMLRQQARLQLDATQTGQPTYELLAVDPLANRGLQLLPPHCDSDVWFDMEGYPHIEGGLEYLFGVTYLDSNGTPVFKDWWAHNRAEERVAFEQFIDWAYAVWQRDPSMHIYHYAAYEISALRRLCGAHGTREVQLDDLQRNHVFVDLYQIVKQGLRVGEPRYSIKNLEHFYMRGRETDVKNAVQSLVYYAHWLEQPDGADWHTSSTLNAIRAYNKDDCDSTMLLTKWLRSLQAQGKIVYVPSSEKDGAPQPTSLNAALAQELLGQLPIDRSNDPERWRVHELMAHLLEFHRRERKPVYWAMFDRQSMTDQQLINDPDCLGGLERTSRAREPIKNSYLYEYKFDPEQETKLYGGQACLIAHDLSRTVLHAIDRDRGLALIKLGPSKSVPPAKINLLPDEAMSAEQLESSIRRVAQSWMNANDLPGALACLLFRQPPKISGQEPGDVIVSPGSSEGEILEAISGLSHSTLCIQGPPGTGKTTIAARAIVDLLRQGKRIGVTANSHKAIDNLLARVESEAVSQHFNFRGIKVGCDDDGHSDRWTEDGLIDWEDDSEADSVLCSSVIHLVGATPYKFARETARNQLDYLFVDEAGQVALANVVAVAASTQNIVLLGDQMQLDQPLKGKHPGESGQSSLNYLLGDLSTVPPHMGIFLSLTWRLNPQICSVISETVYDGRLVPGPNTHIRTLIRPGHLRYVSKDAGVLQIPIEHDGNAQASSEEAKAIRDIVDELLSCQVRDHGGVARPVELDDILIVAPYNLQVRQIKRLAPDARVASVDKFQGQEAPIVILSMCASDGNASSRGLDFLFSKNRLNVALSRAQTLAIVVAAPALLRTKCSTIDQMRLMNFYCRVIESGTVQAPVNV